MSILKNFMHVHVCFSNTIKYYPSNARHINSLFQIREIKMEFIPHSAIPHAHRYRERAFATFSKAILSVPALDNMCYHFLHIEMVLVRATDVCYRDSYLRHFNNSISLGNIKRKYTLNE